MDHIRKLQRQARKRDIVCLIVMDGAVGLLAAMFIAFDTWEELLRRMKNDSGLKGSTLMLLTAVIVCNFVILRHLLTQHPSVKNLPPEIRAAINEQCMTGMCYGNGILCEDGYLLVTERELKVAGPGELDWIDERKALFGSAKSLWVMTRQHQWLVISSAWSRLRGNGTFRYVDYDTFRRELDRIISGDSVRSDADGKPSEVLFRGTNVETLLDNSEEE